MRNSGRKAGRQSQVWHMNVFVCVPQAKSTTYLMNTLRTLLEKLSECCSCLMVVEVCASASTFTLSTTFKDAPFSTSTRTVSVCPFTIAHDRKVIPLWQVLAGHCVCVCGVIFFFSQMSIGERVRVFVIIINN